jgi:uncharacterized protein YbjQ (UPF0145 family)
VYGGEPLLTNSFPKEKKPSFEMRIILDRSYTERFEGARMIVTTTPAIQGRPVKDYLGIVSGEVVLGEQLFTGLPGFGNTVLDARHRAVSMMIQRAEAQGANAVVGIPFELEVQSLLRYVMVTGTAVFIP